MIHHHTPESSTCRRRSLEATCHPPPSPKRLRTTPSHLLEDNDDGDDEDRNKNEATMEYIETFSKDDEGNDADVDASSSNQRQTALAEIDGLLKLGFQAFRDCERFQQENTLLRDENTAQASELTRLRKALQQKQEIITVRIPRVQISRVHEAPLPRATTTLFWYHSILTIPFIHMYISI